MAAEAFHAPWVPGFNAKELREKFKQGYKRATKKSLAAANMGYSMSRGYYDKEEDKWGPKLQKPPTRTVRLANGRYVKVYDDSYGDGTQYSKGFDLSDNSNEGIAEYIDSTSFTYAIDGCGHIAKLEYSPRRNVMRVTFQPETETINGKTRTWGRDDIAVYFRVPTAVFGELYWLAESKVKQASPVTGQDRHALGIKFWDLVRIRHTRTGGRYPYTVSHIKEYAKKDKPVSEWKMKQDYAEDQLYGKGSAAEYDASDEAFKKTVRAIKKEEKGSTAKDQAIAAEWGNRDIAEKAMDSYSVNLKSTMEKNNYAALKTLTDKYNYLVTHNIMDDWLNEKEE